MNEERKRGQKIKHMTHVRRNTKSKRADLKTKRERRKDYGCRVSRDYERK